MISYREYEGKIFFCEVNPTYKGKWVALKMCSMDEIAQKHEAFRKKYGTERKGNIFVKNCAKAGLFNNDMSKEEIELAITKGILPERFTVHHILPLSLGGNNEESNLCVIHNDLHIALHNKHLTLIRDEWDSQKYPEAYLYIPQNLPFLTMSDLNKFFTPEECESILVETEERHSKNEYHQKRKQEIKKQQKTIKKQNRFSKKIKKLTPQTLALIEKKYRHHKKVLAKQEELHQLELMPKPILTYKDSTKYHTARIKKMRRDDYNRE